MPKFIDNVSAFAKAFGPENPSLVVGLAAVPWPSGDHRDDFINALLGPAASDISQEDIG